MTRYDEDPLWTWFYYRELESSASFDPFRSKETKPNSTIYNGISFKRIFRANKIERTIINDFLFDYNQRIEIFRSNRDNQRSFPTNVGLPSRSRFSNKSGYVTVMVVDFFAVEISGVAVPDGGIRIRGS